MAEDGCYRWLGSRLHGFDQSKTKSLDRKFVKTSGSVEIAANRRIAVTLDRRSHNPLLWESELDDARPKIP